MVSLPTKYFTILSGGERMTKKLFSVLALLLVASMLFTACAPAATTVAPTAVPPTAVPPTAVPPTAVPPTKVPPTVAPTAVPPTAAPTATTAPKAKFCLVTDTGGVNDKSFNQSAWKGLQDAQTKLGADIKYLQSKQETDYDKNIQAYIDEKCDLIVTVGFLLGDATAKAAKANPNQKFAIVDYAYDPILPNVLGLTFATDQAGFLAGYLAAGMSKSGKVGTYGGLLIPTVTIFEDGFFYGVAYYNKIKGTKVAVLGWDPVKKTGLAAGGFNDIEKGKSLGNNLLQEGADIIMPVAGGVGLGTFAAVKAAGKGLVIGVDVDQTLTAPEFTSLLLTSVQKVIDVAVYSAAEATVKGTFKGGFYTGTLANNGVTIAPYHDLDAKVSDALKAEITQLKADIISGKVVVGPVK
jgi:basic membrane protein A